MVDSNTSKEIADATSRAASAYGLSSFSTTIGPVIEYTTAIKGVGVATASLLMAVYFPEEVGFFSDEMYYWLVNGGQKTKLKYDLWEYRILAGKLEHLCERLKASAIDVEKVAYVLVKEAMDKIENSGAKEQVKKADLKEAEKAARKAQSEFKKAKERFEEFEEYAQMAKEEVKKLREEVKKIEKHEEKADAKDAEDIGDTKPIAEKGNMKRKGNVEAAEPPRRSKRTKK